MHPAIAIALLLFAALGGLWGWRRGTKALHRRSLHSERLNTMSAPEFERRTIAARKRHRLVSAAIYAIGGAVVGFGLLLAVALKLPA